MASSSEDKPINPDVIRFRNEILPDLLRRYEVSPNSETCLEQIILLQMLEINRCINVLRDVYKVL